MMLNLITQTHGSALAAEVSDQFIHDRIREPTDRQRMELRARLGVSHPKLLAVVKTMEDNLEEPLAQTDIARMTNLSTRQLERLFRKYLDTTPTRYYLNLRLARARHLLRQTSMSILSVALACGFVSASHFSKCYRECYGRHTARRTQPGIDAPAFCRCDYSAAADLIAFSMLARPFFRVADKCESRPILVRNSGSVSRISLAVRPE
jgi:transcriptional regulator GlxA family with amidase domain